MDPYTGTTVQHSRTAPGTLPAGPLRILLVEDNVDAATTLAEILSVWGHTTRLAHDGPAALDIARAEEADVVLLDIGLPGMDGYEVARRMRADALLPDAFLVALTGYGHAEDRRQARDAGFDHHLVKPVDFSALQGLLAGIRV